MNYQMIDTLRQSADVSPSAPMSTRRERLERWADVLEAAAPARVLTLYELEWLPLAKRMALRADGSALALAYEDPVLREAGLKSDRFGDAVSFFGVSERDLHQLLCSCLNGRSVAADQFAAEVRRLAAQSGTHTQAWTRWVPGAVTAGVLTMPVVAYLFG